MRVYLAAPIADDQFRRDAMLNLKSRGHAIIDPIKRRDFRGHERGHEREIVLGDLSDIDGCDAVLGNYTEPGWGTGMESWYANSIGKPVVAYIAPEARLSPWVAHIAREVHRDLSRACESVTGLSYGRPWNRQSALVGRVLACPYPRGGTWTIEAVEVIDGVVETMVRWSDGGMTIGSLAPGTAVWDALDAAHEAATR